MAMRTIAITLALAAVGCKGSSNAGAEEAKKQAEKEQKEKEASGQTAKKITPPVAGGATLPCANVLDANLLTQALGEVDPVVIQETEKLSRDPDAAAACSIMRGGKKLDSKGQAAKLKSEGRLGVLGGNEICTIQLFCWSIEDAERFAKKCAEKKNSMTDELGFPACVQVVITGKDDVKNFKFFDEDTKCLIEARGGPSNVDNDLIGKCAKAAHGLIGIDQIKPGGAPAPAPAEPAPAEGSGSAK